MNRFSFSASIIGNVIEWYDFTLFASLAPVIAHNFFPSHDPSLGLISTFFVFAIGFLFRPLGSIIFGYFGDRIGRAKTLQLSLLFLSLPTLLIGLLPTYAQMGIVSPLLLMGLRLLQGICIGGEFAGSMIYLTEGAPSHKRALWSSMSNNGSNGGVLLATGVSALIATYWGELAFYEYAWRFPFILGGIAGLFGLFWRRNFQETLVFQKLSQTFPQIKQAPFWILMKEHKKDLLWLIVLLTMSAAGSYILMGYLSTYLHTYRGYTTADALRLQTFFIIASIIATPLFAVMSDRYGRRSTLGLAAVGYIILSFPCFYFLTLSQSWLPLLLLVLVYSLEQAVTPCALVEMFSARIRYTGISFGYNISMSLIGGTSPLLNTWLIGYFKDPMVIAYYLMLCAAVSLIAVIWGMPKTFGKEHSLLF